MPSASRLPEPTLELPVVNCDLFVYGSTPGGIAAAVEAARRGLRVVLACSKKNPGGMAASGLCTTDAVRQKLFGGFVLEFVQRVRHHYAKTLGMDSPEWPLIHEGWYYAPSVAEAVFAQILAEASATLEYRPGHPLLSVQRDGGLIQHVELENAAGKHIVIQAATYIDATYEGDLAAATHVPYRVSREGRDEYGESLAGIHYMNYRTGRQILTPDTGEPSLAIQSYCARLVLTHHASHRLPIEKPATYDQHLSDFEPLLDDFRAGRIISFCGGVGGAPLPGGKMEFNGNIEWQTSLNCPGVSWAWPEAGRHHRARLEQFHLDHAAGLFWFLQNDPRVPETIRREVAPYGLDRREFVGNGHWPWQIYVRQGRRIEGRDLITQHHFTPDPKTGRTPRVEHPIAIGEHSFDIHPCHDRRHAVEGFMEGVLWYPQKAHGPAQPGQVPYGAMVPRTVDNLLVPVALSCTHVAMSVLRMEPLWMTTGQVAGLAAVRAKDGHTTVAALDPDPLPRELGIQVEIK